MKVIYYMPLHLQRVALETRDPELLDFCELFKIVNVNACVIDRTGIIPPPMPTEILYPVPEQVIVDKDFGDICLERAQQILDEGRQVFVMYSGGLDSTSVMLALDKVLEGRSRDQVVVAATPDSQREFPEFWKRIILPHYRIMSAHNLLDTIDLEKGRYVQGENGDQLFGSDRVLKEPELLTTAYNADALRSFINSKVENPRARTKLFGWFEALTKKCPLPVNTMSDFLWWVNFTLKWQSVAIRTVSFTNVLTQPRARNELAAFDTFFNTVAFQQLSISGNLRKWGAEPTFRNYKQSARDFIAQHFGAPDYVANKQKVGSLYHVIRHHHYEAPAFGIDDNNLVQGVSYDDLLTLCRN